MNMDVDASSKTGNQQNNTLRDVVLEYDVCEWSSYSSTYHPRNIKTNSPSDQASRWSSASNDKLQYIVLRLRRPSVLRRISFGKYHKAHVCNLKEFRVLAGLHTEAMSEVLHAGLRNDDEPNSFDLPGPPDEKSRAAAGGGDLDSVMGDGAEGNKGNTGNGAEDAGMDAEAAQWRMPGGRRRGAGLGRAGGRTGGAGGAGGGVSELLSSSSSSSSSSVSSSSSSKASSSSSSRTLSSRKTPSSLLPPPPSSGDALGDGVPCEYIRIEPLAAWGPNFNFSIWFVELRGDPTPDVFRSAVEDFSGAKEDEVVRLALKHFRQRGMEGAYRALSLERPGITLEAPAVTHLHAAIVEEGDFDGAETIVRSARQAGVLGTHVSRCSYQPRWTRLDVRSSGVPRPLMRGGHQLCIDHERGEIFLFGGWNGREDLDDMWVCRLRSGRAPGESWELLAASTSRVGGPSPRSCHKMCIDTANRKIYTLGRYVEQEMRGSAEMRGDFYCYHIAENRWELLAPDTRAEGGPRLIYDHQMCIDTDAQMIYVFGGRVLVSDFSAMPPSSAPTPPSNYSGLYSYDIAKAKWALLRIDEPRREDSADLRSRIGHSMLLHPKLGRLFIFAGQRHKGYLSDFYSYDIKTDTAKCITRDSSRVGGPDAGFTQRATIDPSLSEIYVLSGLMRDHESSVDTVKNAFWVYSIIEDRWSCVYLNENVDGSYWESMKDREPCPRFAHQLVYDPSSRTHYLFGGNPGDDQITPARARLDDFWSLNLDRPGEDDLLRRSLFLLRRQKFRELCRAKKDGEPNDATVALEYLRGPLAEVVDTNDLVERSEFEALTIALFSEEATRGDVQECALGAGIPLVIAERNKLFEEITQYFPAEITQPRGNLIDMVTAQF